jgi:hypothetical protein
MLKKKINEMQKVLEKIAKTNKTELDETLWKSLLVKVFISKFFFYQKLYNKII